MNWCASLSLLRPGSQSLVEEVNVDNYSLMHGIINETIWMVCYIYPRSLYSWRDA